MTTATQTKWDQADLAILAEAEAETRRYIKTLKKAAAAGKRLAGAGYAGADAINVFDLGVAPQGTRPYCSMNLILRHLELVRKGGDDLGQFVYHWHEIEPTRDLGEQLQEVSSTSDEPWVTALYGYLFAKGILPPAGGAGVSAIKPDPSADRLYCVEAE
jgi:hypothetical protein